MLLIKKTSIVKGSIFIAASLLFLAACNNEKPKEEAQTEVTVEDSLVSDDTQKVTYSLPSPLQIASIFKKSGMNYKDGVTSQKKDPSKYVSNLSKAINLGVYSADLSYAILNKQNQEALTYMKLSRQVAYNLGIGAIYDEDNLSKRFEKNIGNEDSMACLISDLQLVTDMYLDENHQQQITPIAFAGDWIESLYIASKVIEKNDKQVLNKALAQQMTILESIINALKSEEKKDPAITGLIADLKSIKDIYDALPSVKNNNKGDEQNEKKIILTNEDVDLLSVKIQELRAKFING